MSTGINITIEGLDELWKLRNVYPKKLGLLSRRLHSDLVTKVPKPVSDAVSSLYALKKSDVLARKVKGYNHRTSSGGAAMFSGGDVLDVISVEFRGRRYAAWPTLVSGKSTLPARKKKKGERGNVVMYMPKYTVTVETFRGQPTEITPSGNNRVFAIPRKEPSKGKGGKLLPVVIGKGWKEPLAHGATSVPDAIMNERAVEMWRPKVMKIMTDRLDHHMKTIFK